MGGGGVRACVCVCVHAHMHAPAYAWKSGKWRWYSGEKMQEYLWSIIEAYILTELFPSIVGHFIFMVIIPIINVLYGKRYYLNPKYEMLHA